MHTRVAVTSFPCQRRGGPDQPASSCRCFSPSGPAPSGVHVHFLSFISHRGQECREAVGGGLQQQPTAQGPREERRPRGWATSHAFVLGSLQF